MGIYLGHSRDGSPEILPSFGRLFSALVNAAATGASSRLDIETHGEEIPGDARNALEWLEKNPPSSMKVPSFRSGRSYSSKAYRKEGVFRLEGGSRNYKVTERSIGEGTALAGPVSWIWDDVFPEFVSEPLDRMCADVGCLGEASSMVSLELGVGVEPTHRFKKSRGFFDPGGIEVEVPSEGRLDNLIGQHAESRSKKLPTEAADRHNFSSMPSSEIPTVGGIVKRRIVRIEEEKAVPVPWDRVVAIPIRRGRRVRSADRVSFAVAMHRALISVIGTGAPASITGKYDEGVPVPANRVSVQYLPAGMPVRDVLDNCDHVLLLLPIDMPAEDLDVLASAIERLRTLNSRLGKFSLSPDVQFMDGFQFWAEPAESAERYWELFPAAVPERWAQGDSQAEVYRDTIAWSIGNAVRGLPGRNLSRNSQRRRQELEGAGLDVVWAKPLVTRHPAKYVHRTNRQMPVMPYLGRFRLGAVLPNTAIAAIGQSRHLGGGLLVPRDVAAETVVNHA